jgi:cytochrome b subunit of formate dehydrogenase
MLAELAIANAAFGVIKETIANGGDIMAAGQHIFKFFDSKSEISKKANASGSDSEAFFALEQIKSNEKALQEMFIYQGRAGLWDDWLSFQAEAKRKRDAEAKALALAKIKRKEKIWAWINGVLIVIAVVTGLVIVAGLIWLIATKGNI